MKILAIGDVHNHVDGLENWLAPYVDTHKFIFLGDYFDSFYDSCIDASKTASWLKYSLVQPNRIHLIGNHDISYHPHNTNLYNCPGYTWDKKAAISQILSLDDWNKIKLSHYENGWYFSHAGFTKHWWEHPVTGFSDLQERAEKTWADVFNSYQPSIWEADYTRGGSSHYGGVLWCDWSRLGVIDGINQVVGHTPGRKIRTRISSTDKKTVNICVDCLPSQLLEIDGDQYNIIDLNVRSQYDTRQH
jgi:hypothetical protein